MSGLEAFMADLRQDAFDALEVNSQYFEWIKENLDSPMATATFDEFSNAMQSNRSITALRVDLSKEETFKSELMPLLQVFARLGNLDEVTFISRTIEPAAKFFEIPKKLKIIELNLLQNSWTPHQQALLADAVKDFKDLKVLILAELSGLALDSVLPHLAAAPKLRSVCLSGYHLELDNGPEISPEALLSLLLLPRLTNCCLQNIAFNAKHCRAVAEALGSKFCALMWLRLDNLGQLPHDAAAIAQALALNTRLTRLVASANVFGDPACYPTLARALERNKTLLELEIDQCFLPMNECMVLAPILSALQVNETLKMLSLANNNCNDILIDPLCAMLQANSTLEVLDLRGNFLSNTGTTQLGSALSANQGIKKLVLGEARLLGDQGCLDLTMALNTNDHVEQLEVFSVDNLTDKGRVAMLEALHGNTTLKFLDVASQFGLEYHSEPLKMCSAASQNFGLVDVRTDLDTESQKKLDVFMRLNRHGRKCLIEERVSKLEVVEVLAAVNDDLNCTYQFLVDSCPHLFVHGKNRDTSKGEMKMRRQMILHPVKS